MLDAIKTESILERFFDKCFKYQRTQASDDRNAYELAILDVEVTSVNPFDPQGEPLNQDAKKDFIKSRKIDVTLIQHNRKVNHFIKQPNSVCRNCRFRKEFYKTVPDECKECGFLKQRYVPYYINLPVYEEEE